MLKKIFIIVMALSVWANLAFSKQIADETVMKSTKMYIESLEWDPDFSGKTKEYSNYKDIYIKKLSSQSPEDIFLAAIMLGLLKANESTVKLKEIKTDSIRAKIGISFALCMLKEECQSRRSYLMQLGEVTEMAGRALSLKHLEAVELLSLIRDNGFVAYATKIKKKTNEVWQQEAIDVALERYEKLMGSKNEKN
jgi:hypothetical protein